MLKTLKDLFQLLTSKQKSDLFKIQLLVIIMSALELLAIASIAPFMAIVANPAIIREKAFFVEISHYLKTTNHLELLTIIGAFVIILLTTSSLFSLFVNWKQRVEAQQLFEARRLSYFTSMY